MQKYHQMYFQEDSSRDIVWEEIVRYLERYFPKSEPPHPRARGFLSVTGGETPHRPAQRDWCWGKSVLELGAGYCSFINAISAPKKMAIDIWPCFAKYAKKEVKCRVYDIRLGLLKIIKTKFDLIMASNLLEHLTMEEVIVLIRECYKLLTDRGKLVLIQPNFRYSGKHYFDDYTHKTVFTDRSLPYLLLEHKYKIVRLEARFLPLTFKSRLPKWRFLVRLYLRLPFRPFAGQMMVIAKR